MTEEQPKEVPQPETQTPAQDAKDGDKKERGRGNKRGFGRGGRGQKRGPRGQEEEEWIPCTNLGRLVKSEYVKSLEEIYYHSISNQRMANRRFLIQEIPQCS